MGSQHRKHRRVRRPGPSLQGRHVWAGTGRTLNARLMRVTLMVKTGPWVQAAQGSPSLCSKSSQAFSPERGMHGNAHLRVILGPRDSH